MQASRINFKLLSPFMLVAEHGSFRRAAEELDITQPAVSMQIKQLEEQLGIILFHRTTRRVELSQAGESLLTYVRDAVSQIQEGINAMIEEAEQQRGRVSFACSAIASGLMTPLYGAFSKAFPDVVIRARELRIAEVLDDLRAHDVDFAIGTNVKEHTEFHFQPIFRDDICAIIPRDHVLAGATNVSLADLGAALPILMITPSAANAIGNRRLASAHVRVDQHIDVRRIRTGLLLVESGMGAAILPRIGLEAYDGVRIVALPLTPPIGTEVGIITLRGKSNAQLTTKCIAIATNLLQQRFSRS